jgi:hypothetical protein
MQHAPAIHLVIIQPTGYVHSLGFLDQARYFRHMFRRQGARVTMGKNRLREDAVNFVFGAHLGFPPDWQERHACVFVNLEQLGEGGAAVSPDYLQLLRRSAVVDYDAANVPAYAQDPDDVPIVSFGYGAYLDEPTLALEERPIDLLFFGSMNARRQRFIAQVEAAGFNVAAFDSPVYGPERDGYIRSAKAVLNCHFYDSNRFEQARAFHCLSLGTPVISEYTPTTAPAPAFVDSVLWLPEQVQEWFRLHFDTPAFYEEARKRLAAFRTPDAAHDPMAQYADLLDFASGFQQGFQRVRAQGAWQPRAINVGSGRDYKPTWLNIDTAAAHEPDLVLDFAQPLALPCELATTSGGFVVLEAGSVELVFANSVLERPADLPVAMGNILALLKDGGSCAIEQRCGAGHATVRHDWSDFTDGFWRLGWFEHRFELAQTQWLDDKREPASPERATRVRAVLRKLVTTPRERTLARTMMSDFGMVDDVADIASDDAMPSLMGLPAARPAAAPIEFSSLRQVAQSPAPAASRSPVTPSVMASLRAQVATAAAPSQAQAPAPVRPPAGPHPAGLPASLVALLLDA